jgi:ATP-dependent protease ClpP protease subunit
MPLRAAPVWALLAPGEPRPESWGVRTDVANLATSGLTKMYIYGDIGPWGVEALDVIEALRDISGPVEVHINSMGGSVWEGLAIYQALREHPHDITVVVDGLAASAASFIAMAGKTIEIGAAAHMMIHNAAAYCIGDADAMEASAKMLRNCTEAIAGLYAKRTGGDAADFIAAMAAETWYIGQQAVDAGLADAIRGEDDDEPAFPANAAQVSVFNLAKLLDPPVMRRDDGPDSTRAEDERERPVETDGNTPQNSTDHGTGSSTPQNSSPGEELFSWLGSPNPGLFDHLTKGAAQ